VKSLFLPAVDVRDAQDARRIVRAGLLVIVVAFVGVGGWVSFAPLSGAVIAPGLVKVDTNRKTVQHQEGGIVKEILVRDGDRVAAGQTLVVLDDVRVDATLELLRTQLDAELARAGRLSAEREFARSLTFPKELVEHSKDPRVAELIRRETTLFKVQRETLDSQVGLLESQASETRAEIAARLDQEKAGASSVSLQQEEIDANEALIDQGFVSKTRLLALKRVRTEYEARRSENLAELAQARQRVSELELRAANLRSAYMQKAVDELKESTMRMFDLQERLRPSVDAARRQNIAAPVAGEVVDLKVSTIGSVIGPREPLMDIVPQDLELVVEAHVRPEDINNVAVGAQADVRLTAFKRRITPVVAGSVVYVSADRITDRNSGQSYYVSRVRIGLEALKEAGDLRLHAGMPAEVFVKTNERTVLEYMADPIIGYVRRGLREP
jgi:membrane fusion protein, epimerase transport system